MVAMHCIKPRRSSYVVRRPPQPRVGEVAGFVRRRAGLVGVGAAHYVLLGASQPRLRDMVEGIWTCVNLAALKSHKFTYKNISWICAGVCSWQVWVFEGRAVAYGLGWLGGERKPH